MRTTTIQEMLAVPLSHHVQGRQGIYHRHRELSPFPRESQDGYFAPAMRGKNEYACKSQRSEEGPTLFAGFDGALGSSRDKIIDDASPADRTDFRAFRLQTFASSVSFDPRPD